MAAWLQKRLRDAEALLEQADKTAQRVVIKDKPIALPRVPSGSLGNDQESSAVDTSSRQALERPAQAASADKQVRGKTYTDSTKPLQGQPAGVAIPKARSSAVSRPPVYKSAGSGGGTVEPKKQNTASSLADTEVHSVQLSPIPFMQTGARNRDAALAQPDAPAIRFMPAVPDTDAQAQASSSDNEQASPDALDQATIPHTADLEASGVANNGKHPVVSVADSESSELQASPGSHEVPRPEGQQSPPQAAVSDSEGNAQQLSLKDMTADLAVSQQQLVEGSADISNPDAASQENALDKPDTALNATSTSGSSPQQGAATDLPYQAHTAVAESALQSPFSDAAEPALQLAESVENATPEDTEAVSPLQSSTDVSQAGSQLTQREGSQAQAAAVAEAIRKAAQLSAPPPAQGPTPESAAGHGREMLLTRLVDQLKGRLQTYKEENQQLEEMLHQSDARASSSLREVDRLEDALAKAQTQQLSAEAALTHSSTEQQGQVQAAQQALQAALRDLADCQARVADLENTNALLIQESQVSEGRILAALQDEVTAAEARLEEERAAHVNTQRSAAARDQAVQSSMAEGATALASMQRMVEERTQQASSAQQALMQAQQEQANLTARLHTAQDQAALRQDTEDDHSQLELQVQLERSQHVQSELARSLAAAQSAFAEAKAENEQLQQTVHDLQRHKQDRGREDLQARFKEVTELLYTKQTQLEHMAAEKAAQQLAHEREIVLAKDDAERVKRRVRTERAGTSYASNLDDVVVPMDSLGEAFDRLANDNRVGSYVKAGARALDATASAAVRLIKQYPLGRLFVFLYFVSIHLFIYILISKMQRSALDHVGHPSLTMDDLNSRM